MKEFLELFLMYLEQRKPDCIEAEVPVEVLMLPCGCRREGGDEPFTIRKLPSGSWSCADCGVTINPVSKAA